MAGVIVLDASVLIGYLDGADAHHARAQHLLTEAVEADLGVNAGPRGVTAEGAAAH